MNKIKWRNHEWFISDYMYDFWWERYKQIMQTILDLDLGPIIHDPELVDEFTTESQLAIYDFIASIETLEII